MTDSEEIDAKTKIEGLTPKRTVETSNLLGYDLRACASDYLKAEWSAERRQTYLLQHDLEWPLSVDTTVWPSLFHFTSRRGDYRPVETIDVEPTNHLQLVLRLWDDIVAMETTFRQNIQREVCFVRVAIELWDHPSVLERTQWEFVAETLGANGEVSPEWTPVGFDIADADLVSGLTNCGYKEKDYVELSGWTDALNEFGLFRDVKRAMEFRRFTEERVPQHVPFFVYRLLADL